jgi:hypothetical protein
LPLFDAPRTENRRSWSDYSLDYKAFFIWEVSLLALMVLGTTGATKAIPVAVYAGALATWFVVLSGVVVTRRFRENWRWPGLSGRAWMGAGLSAVLAAIFFFVFSRGLLPVSRETAPMLLFALSIVVFGVLQSLDLVQFYEEDFKKHCADADASPVPEDGKGGEDDEDASDPKWKRVVRGCHRVLFMLVWLEGMGFFYLHQRYAQEGSRTPTATQTESFNEHGTLIYLTHDQMTINKILERGMMIGIPLVILGGFFLHFVVGVSMFSNMPKARGLFGKDPD